MNFDDYEQIPATSTATNMIAGGAAGILEHCVMYPMDSIKVSTHITSNIKHFELIQSIFDIFKFKWFFPSLSNSDTYAESSTRCFKSNTSQHI